MPLFSCFFDTVYCVAVKYGPPAIDSRYGTPDETTQIDSCADFTQLSLDEKVWYPQIKASGFGYVNGSAKTITPVDYATAGSLSPGEEKFRLWVPVVRK